MDATTATTRSASMQRSRLVEAARRLHALAEQVKMEGACSLPGVSLDYTSYWAEGPLVPSMMHGTCLWE